MKAHGRLTFPIVCKSREQVGNRIFPVGPYRRGGRIFVNAVKGVGADDRRIIAYLGGTLGVSGLSGRSGFGLEFPKHRAITEYSPNVIWIPPFTRTPRFDTLLVEFFANRMGPQPLFGEFEDRGHHFNTFRNGLKGPAVPTGLQPERTFGG